MKTIEILFFTICAITIIGGFITAIRAQKLINTLKTQTVRK